MDTKVVREIEEALKDTMHMNIETTARLMLLCELLIEKGYLNDKEVMNKLSQKEVDKMISESEEL